MVHFEFERRPVFTSINFRLYQRVPRDEKEINMSIDVVRLLSMPGYEERSNDVIFIPRQFKLTEEISVVVFFGGDVQDYPENMKSHRDHGTYVDYNLEEVAKMLSLKFEKSYILIIKPVKMELKTFSCFSNFVPCNHIGSPSHEPNHNALLHLSSLLHSVAEKTGHLEIGSHLPLTIIGFSKGCVVLNQFLHELHYYHHLPTDHESHIGEEFLNRIKKFIWLDGGHSGGKDTWITSPTILSVLEGRNLMVDIHLTPYQISDDCRPWIKKEEKVFYSTLKKLRVFVSRKTHFDGEPPSLKNHFLLLKKFC